MYKCKCGWIGHTPKKKSKNKVKFLACPDCTKVVQNYDIPLTDRIGRCSKCGYGAFTLEIKQSVLYRKCKGCEEIVDVNREMGRYRRI